MTPTDRDFSLSPTDVQEITTTMPDIGAEIFGDGEIARATEEDGTVTRDGVVVPSVPSGVFIPGDVDGISEFFIVLSRFIFEYEQAFQGDLVRFWYSALYLFASAYALMHEGHVRVDVLYTGFSERKKAWTNSMGSLLLGIPLCLIVLFLGMGGGYF